MDAGDDPVTAAAPVTERARADRVERAPRPAGPSPRLAIVLPAALALLAALYAGLLRIGWALPAAGALPAEHGPLMVGGFLGTVVTLERAVALGRRSGFVYPALGAAGALALLAGGGAWAAVLITAGSAGLVGLSVAIARRHPALHHTTLALGAASWLVGNAFWVAGWPIYRLVPWWVGFLVLTIAGERLELSRPPRAGAPSPPSRPRCSWGWRWPRPRPPLGTGSRAWPWSRPPPGCSATTSRGGRCGSRG